MTGERSNEPVRAAGGVVWRRGDDGQVEILLVHRPKYDDWSLPKGKVDTGEAEEQTARREVEEETGLRTVLGRELDGSTYHDRQGREKTVRYWSMAPDGGAFTPSAEVDEVRWVSVPEALALLTYERDRQVLASLQQS